MICVRVRLTVATGDEEIIFLVHMGGMQINDVNHVFWNMNVISHGIVTETVESDTDQAYPWLQVRHRPVRLLSRLRKPSKRWLYPSIAKRMSRAHNYINFKKRKWDCSYFAKQAGVSNFTAATAAEQARYCVDNNLCVLYSNLQPGDLIFWSFKNNGRYKNISHVGMYASNGYVIDASSSRGMVVYRPVFGESSIVCCGRSTALLY